MTRVIHPKTYLFGGKFLTCPDCGKVRWGVGSCKCGARLIGPWRSTFIDETRRNWLIAEDGTARLWPVRAD